MYTIRLCRRDEKHKLQAFIDSVWKKDHILTKSDKLLDWQHLSNNGQYYTFYVAENNNTKTFDAILGFIPVNHFDPGCNTCLDTWLAIWKRNDNSAEDPSIGLELLMQLKNDLSPNSVSAIGVSKFAKNIYKALGYKVETLDHYYILNPTMKDFSIAQVHSREKELTKDSHYLISDIKSYEELQNIERPARPSKSITYFKNRYGNHPTYKYEFLGIYKKNILQLCLIVREIKVKDAKCYRIVDYYGDLATLNSLELPMMNFLKYHNAEYIDFLQLGYSHEVMTKMGFKLKNDNIIIPNHFEPFERKNVDVIVAYKSDYHPFYIVKGDSDLDRPNTVE